MHPSLVPARAGNDLHRRVIECNECGATISAANDEELREELSRHMKEEHSDAEWDDERASEVIGEQAYTATDS